MKHAPLLAALCLCILCCDGVAASPTRVLGADLSMLPVYEQAGAIYRNANGAVQDDPLLFFRDAAGIRCVRVRLFVNPSGETGVCQDLAFVKDFGRRIKEAGMAFMLDFHYSDTWADPAKQYIPRGWPTESAALQKKLYDYTTESLKALVDAGATPDYIQMGNEISYGMCSMTATYDAAARKWSDVKKLYPVYTSSHDNWRTLIDMLNQCAKACREQCPQAKLILHTERAADAYMTDDIYERFTLVDYDIIGLSYYPFWHKDLTTLAATLNKLAVQKDTKEVMIVETAYNNAWYPTGQGVYDYQSTWPASPAGQETFIKALIAELLKHPNVTGLFYWMPEENPYGNHVYEPWLNRGLFANGNGSVGQWDASKGGGNYALPALAALRQFTEGQPDGIRAIQDDGSNASQRSAVQPLNPTRFDLSGRPATSHQRGITVPQGRKTITHNPH